jgi:2-polyprenyl-3-methyl-5-hydroxy-6-metoxy-1,4-benzoquinol methylase
MAQWTWEAHVAYFALGAKENPKFWGRLGGIPQLTGKRVLDVGCGHGSLCVEAAQAGAALVIGVDLDAERIDFASRHLAAERPELTSRVEFRCCALQDILEHDFDVILSKDAMEHIINLDAVIAAMSERLTPGGRLYVGFGPLYNGPYGDHRRTRLLLPWAHTLVPEHLIVKYLHLLGRTEINSIHDLGLNALALRDYQRLVAASGLNIIQFGVNVSNNPLLRLFFADC